MLKLRIREKITGLLVLYFILALIAIGFTLFVSWKLEGGAAAINDAGRERMRSYRIAYLLTQQVHHPSPVLRQELEQEIVHFEHTLAELHNGNPQRPLFLPKETGIQQQMGELQRSWEQEMKPRIMDILDSGKLAQRDRLLAAYRPAMESYVAGIDALVLMVERSNAQATTLLRSIQITLVVVALIGTILLDYIFSLVLVRPVQRLNEGLQSMGKADFGVRLPVTSSDELGELALGFNQMAEKLQNLYDTLEQRVEEKTRGIETKSRELATLYDVASFLNSSKSAELLCDGVLERMVPLIGAVGGVVRLTDAKQEQLQVVAARGVSDAFLADETYLAVGRCICGEVARDGIAVSADFTLPSHPPLLQACSKDGFKAVAAIPIRSSQNAIGMLNLFFDAVRILPPAEVRLLESVGLHLGVAIENQRLIARQREMAIFEERNLLAQELHDSIAQSLAFLNLQAQMLQDDLEQKKLDDAMLILAQIREGVQESYDDVRELLVHFRTRMDHPDLESAIASALQKFEGQIGIRTRFVRNGPLPDIAPEHTLQAMHILQESLSNIRKHAQASEVEVELSTAADCQLTIRDDGRGFDPASNIGDTHVGIRIMRERAHRFGGTLNIVSTPGQGTTVSLRWLPTPITTEQRDAA